MLVSRFAAQPAELSVAGSADVPLATPSSAVDTPLVAASASVDMDVTIDAT